MVRLWSAERRFEVWREVEVLACEAWAQLGVVPAEAAARIRRAAAFPIDRAFVERVEALDRQLHHDVIAFVTALGERLGDDSRYVHYGLTSYDVVDTALGVLLSAAAGEVAGGLEALQGVVGDLARRYRDTPMVGRTHGVHAEPTTFGLKLAVWYAEIGRHRERLAEARRRVAVGKLSGAVGTYAHVDPRVEAYVCERLGLAPAPASTQVVQRDRHAEFLAVLALIASSLEKFATELRNLARTEVREVEEAFAAHQKGSSAMPHKRNPWRSERICGLARVVRGYLTPALESVNLWHERDISNSSVERVILPDATSLVDFMIADFAEILRGLRVHPDRMRRQLDLAGGIIASQEVLLALVRRGMGRDDAYAVVQRLAMQAWDEERSFRDLAARDPEVRSRLSPADLDACFDFEAQLRHVGTVFARLGLD